MQSRFSVCPELFTDSFILARFPFSDKAITSLVSAQSYDYLWKNSKNSMEVQNFICFRYCPMVFPVLFLKTQKIIGIETPPAPPLLQEYFDCLKCGGIGHPFLIDILRHRHFRLFLEFLTEGGHAPCSSSAPAPAGSASVQMLVDIVQNLHQRILCSCTQRRLLESCMYSSALSFSSVLLAAEEIRETRLSSCLHFSRKLSSK